MSLKKLGADPLTGFAVRHGPAFGRARDCVTQDTNGLGDHGRRLGCDVRARYECVLLSNAAFLL